MADSEELGDEVKTFIVQSLACWDTPSVVAKAVKDEFGLEVSRQRVQTYDPTKKAGEALSQRLRVIFDATRAEYIAETAQIPISFRSYRLRKIERMAAKAESLGNMPLAAAMLEQAAKEVGGAFTNRRELSGPGGGPIKTETAPSLTDEELERIARGGSAGAPAPPPRAQQPHRVRKRDRGTGKAGQ
jgi:hypothetical protein